MPSQPAPAAFSITHATALVYHRHGRFVFARVIPLVLAAAATGQLAGLALPPFPVFLAIVPLTYGLACTIALAPLLAPPGEAPAQAASRPPYLAVFIVFALQVLLLVAPWLWLSSTLSEVHEAHRNDYVAMIGSGDTPEEAATIQLVMLFFCLYPLLIFGYYVALPMLLRPAFTPDEDEVPSTHRGCAPALLLLLSPVLTFGVLLILGPLISPWSSEVTALIPMWARLLRVLAGALAAALVLPFIAMITISPYQPGGGE